jgi:translation initiation factor 1
MGRQNKNNRIVFSTNPDFEPWDDEMEQEQETLPPQEQMLTITLDKKQRKGKKVTLINGFIGTSDDLKELGKLLKTKCGVGGSVKNGEIIIQGDFRETVKTILEKMGYGYKVLF